MSQLSTWIRALKCGSQQAFDKVYERYADKVYRVCCRMHLQEEEAEEIVQEVFIALWEQRFNLNENLSLNAYLLTITRNKIFTLQKKKVAELSRNFSWQSSQATRSKNVEEMLVYQDMESHTFQFIDNLPSRKKQIFILSRRNGLSNEEIAQYLNLSKRTVENNIYQVEKAIHQFLLKSKFIIQSLILFLYQIIFW